MVKCPTIARGVGGVGSDIDRCITDKICGPVIRRFYCTQDTGDGNRYNKVR